MALTEEEKRERRAAAKERRQQMMAEKFAKPADIDAAPVEDAEDYFPPQEPEAALPEPEVEEVAEPPRRIKEPDLDDDMELLLAGIDPRVVQTFSKSELRAIIQNAREKADEAQRSAALSVIRSRAETRARIAAGLVPAETLRSAEEIERLNEPVTVRIRLPSQGAGGRGAHGIRLDQKIYETGRMYTVTRAVAETLNEIISRSWQHEFIFKGLKGEDYRMMLEVVNAYHLSGVGGVPL